MSNQEGESEDSKKYIFEKIKRYEIPIDYSHLSSPERRTDLRYTGGNRLCPGCGQGTLLRNLLLSTPDDVIVTNNTGCVFVSTSAYPYSSWLIPYLHTTLAGAPAAMSGIIASHKFRLKNGDTTLDPNLKFLIYSGDGGFYDIGLSVLSGAFNRGDNVFAVCGNNQAYMNTGIQESGATTDNIETTTTVFNESINQTSSYKKDLTQIMEKHGSQYVCQTGVHDFRDLLRKSRKGFDIEGPTFMNCYAPCPLGWEHPSDASITASKLAADTCIFPSYEIEQGGLTITSTNKFIYEGSKEKLPIEELFKTEGRYKHLFTEDDGGYLIEMHQKRVDREWAKLCRRADHDKELFE